MREGCLWIPKETHEKDLSYNEQLVVQKLQAALKPKELIEKGLVAGLSKFSITPSERAVIDWVCFVRSHRTNGLDTPHCLLFNQESYKQAEKYLQNNYGHPDHWK